MPSTHTPFTHGLDAHSSIWTWQLFLFKMKFIKYWIQIQNSMIEFLNLHKRHTHCAPDNLLWTNKARITSARVVVQGVVACAVKTARLRSTIVYQRTACVASVARSALAIVALGLVYTHTTVQTRIWLTWINEKLTTWSKIVCWTLTCVKANRWWTTVAIC